MLYYKTPHSLPLSPPTPQPPPLPLSQNITTTHGMHADDTAAQQLPNTQPTQYLPTHYKPHQCASGHHPTHTCIVNLKGILHKVCKLFRLLGKIGALIVQHIHKISVNHNKCMSTWPPNTAIYIIYAVVPVI